MSPTHRKRPVLVTAVQFKKGEPWPSGVFKYWWNVGPVDNNEELPIIKIGPYGAQSYTWLRDGDWVVTYKSGRVDQFTNDQFVAMFEEIEACLSG
jgi:hypothetical protein